ncbi:MAG TPA: glycosyl hydrolase family 28-related protein [Stellaceae bacterium]|nr:glycosyl hydrolase family 28-related protein [Stellaceae bacterium]
MNAERRDFLWLTALGLAGGALAAGLDAAAAANAGATFDIRSFGASGDGKTIDSPAINRAIAAAAAAAGGVVRFPAGTYACYSIRLASFVTLLFEPGATILAAPPPGYDAAESNAPWEAYQDFGHNHWHNSLIWGENLHDVALLGPGRIWGRGLSRGEWPEAGLPPADAPGAGDKAIALKRCRNVILRDFSILAGGHFGILATGVDNLAIDGISIDTNRDGMDIDACRNVQISNCRVNSPLDDGICLKSSFALGEARATENVTISGCHVTGYKLGTVFDGAFEPLAAAMRQVPTGRIKLGTESNGGFKNISISNCTFESCRGFALETVDGGALEDISFTGVTMRDIRNAPFFLRLGARLRGPPGITVGTLRRIIISDVVCDAPANDMPAIISGIPRHPIEDVTISDVYLVQRGGVPTEPAAIDPPEEAKDYPEPSRFGRLPAQALFVRHARNLEISHLEIASKTPDARPVCWLSDVDGAAFTRFKPPSNAQGAAFLLQDTRRFRIAASPPVPDTTLDTIHQKRLP